MITENEVKEMLIETKAIMEGHFLLTSGLHSPLYVEKFNVLQHPEYTEKLCKALAECFGDANIETVVGPMTGGILLAHGGVPVAVGILVDRSGGRADFGDVPYQALLRLDVTTYDPKKDCPLCKSGIPMTKRGRTGK